MSSPAYRSADPARTYYGYNAAWSFFAALTFTLSMVYYVREAGLSPLQLVLVGTTLELACFLFEIPTGVVADLFSRRLSVIIGFLLIGSGFLLQALVPEFLAILGAQVLWGVGYTFTSGASQAWITDEVGEDPVARVFVRSQQFALAAKLAGMVTAGALGLVSPRLPMTVSGVGMLLLGLTLTAVMAERNFHPAPRAERETFRHAAETFRHGLSVARGRPVVRTLALVTLISGLASEAFDRLWSVKILTEFSFPDWFGTTDPAFWFAALALIGTLLSLTTSLVITRVSPQRLDALHPHRLLAVLALVYSGGIVAFALFEQLWLVLAAYWLTQIAVTLADPIEATWLNRAVESRSRATVISMVSQLNAIGQVAGGPPLGALAGRAGLRTALLVSGLIVAPIPLLYLRFRAVSPRPDRIRRVSSNP